MTNKEPNINPVPDTCKICGAGCCNCEQCIAIQKGEEHICFNCLLDGRSTEKGKPQ